MSFGNSPEQVVVLELEARKSFSLGIWLQDESEKPLDITGCNIKLVVRKKVRSTDTNDSNNLVVNSSAQLLLPGQGYCRFNLQSTDTNWDAGEYIFAVVLIDSSGYSAAIVKGYIQLNQNTEFGSLSNTYSAANPPTSLSIKLREQNITVQTGPSLAPGATSFLKSDEQKLDELYAKAVAAGQTLNADLIPDGVTKVIMTLAERVKLANLQLAWADITGKPAFGDIITHNVSEFLPSTGIDASKMTTGTLNKNRVPRLIDLNGVTAGTAAPSSGTPGAVYLKYVP